MQMSNSNTGPVLSPSGTGAIAGRNQTALSHHSCFVQSKPAAVYESQDRPTFDYMPKNALHRSDYYTSSLPFSSYVSSSESRWAAHEPKSQSFLIGCFGFLPQTNLSESVEDANCLAISPISNTSHCSSPQLSDEEFVTTSWPPNYKERARGTRRREAHTQAEQKRRDEIRKGYQALQDALPLPRSSDGASLQRVSKANVLQSSIEYIDYLTDGKQREQTELESLRKDLMALQIMKESYEKMVLQMPTSDRIQEQINIAEVPDTDKFQLFQCITDELFNSFDIYVNPSSFAELSGTAFGWLEEHCKPSELHRTVSGLLHTIQRLRCDTGSAILLKRNTASNGT